MGMCNFPVDSVAYGSAYVAHTTTGTTPTYYGYNGGVLIDTGAKSDVEANTQQVARGSGVFRNARCYVRVNSKASDSTLTLRKNGADTDVAVTITASTTGEFTSTGEVSFEDGDLFNWQLENPGAGQLDVVVMEVEAIR